MKLAYFQFLKTTQFALSSQNKKKFYFKEEHAAVAGFKGISKMIH